VGRPEPGVRVRLGDSGVLALWTGCGAGDQRGLDGGAGTPAPVPRGLVVRHLNQQHGSVVVAVDAKEVPSSCVPWPSGSEDRLPDADAVLSMGHRSCLAVLSADCATVALASREGVFAAAHVGWRGLVAGVVERALGAMRSLGATEISAGLGPCIHACCYGFAAPELDAVARRYGDRVRALTARGEPALDLPQAVHSALAVGEAQLVVDLDRCTACESGSFSYRARRDEGRQALFVWLGPDSP
jgi:polyphenol oxidase